MRPFGGGGKRGSYRGARGVEAGRDCLSLLLSFTLSVVREGERSAEMERVREREVSNPRENIIQKGRGEMETMNQDENEVSHCEMKPGSISNGGGRTVSSFFMISNVSDQKQILVQGMYR